MVNQTTKKLRADYYSTGPNSVLSDSSLNQPYLHSLVILGLWWVLPTLHADKYFAYWNGNGEAILNKPATAVLGVKWNQTVISNGRLTNTRPLVRKCLSAQ